MIALCSDDIAMIFALRLDTPAPRGQGWHAKPDLDAPESNVTLTHPIRHTERILLDELARRGSTTLLYRAGGCELWAGLGAVMAFF
jgi:hypothetical protein